MKTKEQLLIEATKLKKDNEEWADYNLRRKKEFAKAFGWYKSSSYSYSEKEPLEPSWEEIFVKIGGLLENVDVNSKLNRLQATLESQGFRLDKLEEKK